MSLDLGSPQSQLPRTPPSVGQPYSGPKPQAKQAWIPAAVAGVGLVYDMFRNKKNDDEARDQFNQNMDYSIQRRVADAQKAGVHPLFALGASTGTSPTVQAGTNSQVGANLGRLVRDTVSSQGDREVKTAQVRSLNAQAEADEALAAYRLSGLALDRQALAGQGHDTLNGDGVEVIPDLQIAARPDEFGTTAGLHPMWRESVDDSGLKSKSMTDETLQQFEDVIPTVIFGLKNRRYVATKLMQSDFNPNKYKTIEAARRAVMKWLKNSSFGVN